MKNLSNLKITVSKKEKSNLLKTFTKALRNKNGNSLGDYAQFFAIIITILTLLGKGISLLATAGYNKYFSIGNSFSTSQEGNFLGQFFEMLLVCGVFVVLNIIPFQITKKNKLLKSFFLILLLFIASLLLFTVVIMLYENISFSDLIKLKPSEIKSLIVAESMLIISIYLSGTMLGWFVKAYNSTKAPLIIKEYNKLIDKFIKLIESGTARVIALAIILFLLSSSFFSLGTAFAGFKSDFKLVYDNSYVVLAEKDNLLLCSKCYYNEDDNSLTILKSEQITIESINMDTKYIKTYNVDVK